MAEWAGDLVDLFPAYEDDGVSPPDWDGDVVALTLEKEVAYPIDWPSFLSPPAPIPTGPYTNYYVMRGFRHAHIPPDFETWIAVGLPNALNPSGEPIQDVSIQLTWFEINV